MSEHRWFQYRPGNTDRDSHIQRASRSAEPMRLTVSEVASMLEQGSSTPAERELIDAALAWRAQFDADLRWWPHSTKLLGAAADAVLAERGPKRRFSFCHVGDNKWHVCDSKRCGTVVAWCDNEANAIIVRESLEIANP